MAAATVTGTRAAVGIPQAGTGHAGSIKAAYGTVTVDASSEDGDIFQAFRVPANCTVIGGYVMAGDGDTGIETLDIDIGWAATDDEIADPDGFGNLGVWTGDAGEGGTIEPGNHFQLGGVLLSAGPKAFSAEAIIQLETNVAAATGVAMEVTVVVLYLYNI